LNLKPHFGEIYEWIDEKNSDHHYREKIAEYYRIADAKAISIKVNLPEIIKGIKIEHEEIEKLSKERKPLIEQAYEDYRKLSSDELAEFKTISNKLYAGKNKITGLFSNQLSELFFCIEFQAKMMCGLLCLKFADKIKNGEIIQHNEIFQTLKKISWNKDNSQCRTCPTNKSCGFNIDFNSYAKLYAMYIKLRMISDYTEIFYFGDFGLLETIYENFYHRTLSIHEKFELIIDEIDFVISPIKLKDIKY
jgi:hypothetical protein